MRAWNCLQECATQDRRTYWTLSVETQDAGWDYGENIDEFFADYNKIPLEAQFAPSIEQTWRLRVAWSDGDTNVSVASPSRAEIERISRIFDEARSQSGVRRVSARPRIFLGHGRDPQWRDLRDHLQDKQQFEIVAYETGSRTSQHIQESLHRMLEECEFGLHVLTGENVGTDGTSRARDNVIHELRLWQGKWGFHRVAVLLENGTEEFSNIAGVDQVRFTRGNIAAAFGDVVAAINRAFPPQRWVDT